MSSSFSVLVTTLREILAYRELLLMLTLRDLRARYRGYGLGYLWSILNPVLLLIVYLVVFSTILKVGIEDFALFLACGLLPWLWFSDAVSGAVGSVRHGEALVRRVYFPTQILPLVPVGSQLVHFALSLPLLLGVALLLGRGIGIEILGLIPLVLVQLVFTSGASLAVGSLGVRYRDLEYLLRNFLLILFFLVPIIYTPEMVPGMLREVLAMNPLAVLIDGYQDVIYRRTWPDWGLLALASASSLLLLGIGVAVFDRQRWAFAEQI